MRKPNYCSLSTYSNPPAGCITCLSCTEENMPEACRRLNEAAPTWEKEICGNCWHYRGVFCMKRRTSKFDDEYACKKFTQKRKDMTLHEYQLQAMMTCMESSRNFPYMILNLVGEVGELASKVAKAIRKEEAMIDYRGDLRHPSTRRIDDELEEAMQKEVGDVLWQLAGLCSVMGWDLNEIAQMNLDKLASRQQRGVIDGNGDER